ncbi:MAG: helix-turn-helix transcriptional regulator [Bacteroidetes bacterium]|nr:helix-turn-helix transcriptional regulator [Bacteroidota bacterium]
MPAQALFYNITCVSVFLLSFISLLNPLRVNVIANRWFGLFLFSMGCMLLSAMLSLAKMTSNYPRLMAFSEMSRFIIAPALYLSILHFTLPEKVFKKSEWLHFIPFFLFFLFAGPVFFSPEAELFKGIRLPAFLMRLLPILIFLAPKLQVLGYWILAYRKLRRHQYNIRLINSSTAAVSLNWLRYLLLAIALLILIWFNSLFFRIQMIGDYAPLFILGGVLLICYFLLAQREIYPFEAEELADIDVVIAEDRDSKTMKPRLADNELEQLKAQLVQLMEQERPYLDNELSLPQLAKEMDISTHDLSWLLNEGFGKNFFQFINAYRVEEAKSLMLSEKHRHLNLLGIAYAAGFNSKTTFNTAFKKETGVSPSQFIQQAQARTNPGVSY